MRELRWKNASPEQSSCVDLAIEVDTGFVRDSKNHGPIIALSPHAWVSFINYAKTYPGNSDVTG